MRKKCFKNAEPDLLIQKVKKQKEKLERNSLKRQDALHNSKKQGSLKQRELIFIGP
jgi:hypothetical protein